MQKPQMRAGTHRAYSNSDAKHAVVHAKNDRSFLGPTEACSSSPKVAVLHAQNHRLGLEPI